MFGPLERAREWKGNAFDSGPAPWQGTRRFKTDYSKVAALANPELGAKQICPTCSTKFYDLGRRPAVCPQVRGGVRSRGSVAQPPRPREIDRAGRRSRTGSRRRSRLTSKTASKPSRTKRPELDAVVDEPPLSDRRRRRRARLHRARRQVTASVSTSRRTRTWRTPRTTRFPSSKMMMTPFLKMKSMAFPPGAARRIDSQRTNRRSRALDPLRTSALVSAASRPARAGR